MIATCAGTKDKIYRKTTVLWSTDPIDGPLVNPRTENGVRRSQGPSFHRRTVGTMAPKQDPTYAANGKSKFDAPSRRMIIEEDVKYIPPNIRTSPTAPRTTRNRAHQVTFDMVTAPSLKRGLHRSAHQLAQSHHPAAALMAAPPSLLRLIVWAIFQCPQF
uniref:Integrase core domain containing protein n=1 Tax=Solanum tuberosum TaxID=4113 RepID=M1CY39_SOLTU